MTATAPFINILTTGNHFGYQAAESSTRRKAVKVDHRPEEVILDHKKRSKLISGARDLKRNLAIAAWALRTHCAHVAQHTFQSRTGGEAFDKAFEARMRRWSKARECDAAGRHPLPRLIYLTEMGAITDGDAVLLKLSDGRLQAIESDRIASPKKGLPKKIKPESVIHGVQIDDVGRPIAYALNNRTKRGALQFDRMLKAENVIHHGYFDRLDQVRGVSPMAAAINSFLDVAEATEYALAKSKIAQYFGVKIKRADGQSIDAGEESQDTQGPINFGKGPVVFDMENGDDAEFMHADTPGASFQEFMRLTIMIALKSLDIDFSFFDSAHTHYSGARQALLLYTRSARIRQNAVRDVLDDITAWKLQQWAEDGLTLPNGMSIDDVRWEWLPPGLGWIDPLKEVKAHAAAVDAGLDSRQRLARERGEDWFEIAQQLADEQAFAAEKGIALSGAAAEALKDEPETTSTDDETETTP